MDSLIPLFPLNLVVFPNSKHPLHIFEERYKKMIHKCIRNDSNFGIVSKIGSEFSYVGSIVKVAGILRNYPTGEFDILVKGSERFGIIDYRMHEDGYYEAEIKPYGDLSAEVDANLLEEMRKRFEDIVKRTNIKLGEEFWFSYDDSEIKSFKVAEKSGLKLEQQQELLMFRYENERLAYLIEHFEKLGKLISENIITKSIVLGDGYIN